MDIGPQDVNLLLNNVMVIQAIEILPKEKTNQLAVFELSLAPLFKLHESTSPAASNNRPRTGTATISNESKEELGKRYTMLDRLRATLQSGPVATSNATATAQAMAASQTNNATAPTVEVEVVFKKPLISPEDFEEGNMLTIAPKASVS